MPDNKVIYKPLKEYKSIYKNKYNDNVTNYFKELTKQSSIDVSQNIATCKKIDKKEEEKKQFSKKEKKLSILKNFLIILLVVGLFLVIWSGYLLSQSKNNNTKAIATLSISIVFIIGIILLLFLAIYPKIKNFKQFLTKVEKELIKLYNEAYAEMEPLNKILNLEIYPKLFTKTCPVIRMDCQYDYKKFDYLVSNFGLEGSVNKNYSCLFVQSGHINGNPFFIANQLHHRIVDKVYTGSITISWTTYDSKGTSHHHSQVLSASIKKPAPKYSKIPYLVYGNKAAPNLVFSRSDTDCENMSDRQIDKFVKKESKKIKRHEKKNINSGFTMMEDNEFESLFGAINRNNEVEYRLLFTPLARKQMIELIKDREIGYGDDFYFYKNRMINTITADHLHRFPWQATEEDLKSYSYEILKQRYIDFGNTYFKQIYFTLAPILAIPIYQQTKPHEYIYKDVYPQHMSFYEHESCANMIGQDKFSHPDCKTQSILKTKIVSKKDKTDIVEVTSYGYKTIERVEYITKLGGDGHLHTIPIPWTEYIPLKAKRTMDVNIFEEPKENETYKDIIYDYLTKNNLKDDNQYVVNKFLVNLGKRLNK